MICYYYYEVTAERLISQPLSVSTSSLAIAENMADLIDGYCRLESGTETSFIIRSKKGMLWHCLFLLNILTDKSVLTERLMFQNYFLG